MAEGEGVRVVLRSRGARSAPAEVVDGKLVCVGVHEQTDALHIVGEGWTEEYLHLRTPGALDCEPLKAAWTGPAAP